MRASIREVWNRMVALLIDAADDDPAPKQALIPDTQEPVVSSLSLALYKIGLISEVPELRDADTPSQPWK